MYKENKWQKPTCDSWAGLSRILKDAIINDWTHGTSCVKVSTVFNGEITDVIIHSYKETGTALTVACEVKYENGLIIFGTVIL